MSSAPRNRSALRLHLEILLWRHGYAWPVSLALLLAAAALWLTTVWVAQPQLRQQAQTLHDLEVLQTESLRIAQLAGPSGEESFAQARASVRAVMARPADVPEVIRSIHKTAQRHQIEVHRSDYQLRTPDRGDTQTQIVTLPLRVEYARFKPFLFELLRTHPGVSVDQISIKREAVAQNTPEISLRLTIWIDKRAANNPEVVQ